MAKRFGKYYFRDEKEVMSILGLEPTKGSGSGWIEKEDGQNEHIIAQLKSTDADSIRIKKLDLDKLDHNAIVSKKLPVFVIQFLETNEVYLMMKPSDLLLVSNYIKTGVADVSHYGVEIGDCEDTSKPVSKKTIKSSSNSKKKFFKEEAEKWQNKKRSK